MSSAVRAAIVIGNSAYGESRLENPVRDAEAIDERLKELDFETVLARDLSREDTFAAMDEFRSRFPVAETALLFFAGHGVQHESKNYLMPIETKVRSLAGIDRYGINLKNFLDLFDEVADTSIAFLDCCRNNPFLDQALAGTKAEQRDLLPARPGMANVATRNGGLIAYATSPDSTAEDGDGEHSPFTQALLNRLGQPKESILDMLTDVTREVMEFTNNQQRPFYQHSLRQKFIFNPKEAEPAPAQGPLQESDEAAWLAISASNTIAGFDGFIRDYPDSPYSEQARLRIGQIKAAGDVQQLLTAAGMPDLALVAASFIRAYERPAAPAPPRGSRKPPHLGYRNTVDPAFLEGLVSISLYSVAKVMSTRNTSFATAFFVKGSELFGPADESLYALTAAHAVGRKRPSGFVIPPEEALLSFEALNERTPGIDPLPVADLVWESEPWNGGCDVSVLSFGPDLPSWVRPIPIARGLPAIDPASPLSFDSRPRVTSISYPYGGGLRFGAIDSYLLDYDRPIFDEQGGPVDKVITLHHTAASEPGSSGCPLLDEDLEVIGVHIGHRSAIPRLNGLPGHYSANFAAWVQSAIRAANR